MAEPKLPTMTDARTQASGVLFVIAAAQVLFGGIGLALVPLGFGAPIPDDRIALYLVTWFGLGVVFGLLGVWARVRPLPPVIIGLLLYVGLVTANAVIDPDSIMSMIVVKILVVLALILSIITSTSATPETPADAWAGDSSGTDDWDGRSSGKRHDPEKDGYS